MSTHDTLAPDQRAVLELVLRQGRSYGELSELLGIPEREVRERADAGLRALVGEPAAGVDSGRIADWLLGQQPAPEADRTRAAVTRSAAARDWAATAAKRLRGLGGEVSEVPAAHADGKTAASLPARADGEPAASLPAPAVADGRSQPRSSKLGGAILIGVLVVLLGGFGAWFLTRDDGEAPAARQAPTPQPEQTAEPQATGNDIVLSGTGDSQARGLLRLFRQEDGSVQFAIAAEKVPPNRGREVYAVWFTKNGGAARRLGFAQTAVGQDGVLTTGGPQRGDEDRFPRWFATYDKVLVTRETNAEAKKPGPAVLQGTLPGSG